MLDDERAHLEAIAASPDAEEPRAVYADWLLERGGADAVRGRLLAVQLGRANAAPRPELRAEEQRLLRSRALPRLRGATLVWRLGLVREIDLVCSNARWEPAEVRALLEHPACALAELVRLPIQPTRAGETFAQLLEPPWRDRLRGLEIGAFGGVDLVRLAALPRLVDLALPLSGTSAPSVVAALSGARLRSLSVSAHAPDAFAVLRAVLAAGWPLERLSLRQAEGDGAFDELFAGDALPRLRRLGLHGSSTPELLERLAASPLLAKLEVVELDAADVTFSARLRVLRERADAFAHVRFAYGPNSVNPIELDARLRGAVVVGGRLADGAHEGGLGRPADAVEILEAVLSTTSDGAPRAGASAALARALEALGRTAEAAGCDALHRAEAAAEDVRTQLERGSVWLEPGDSRPYEGLARAIRLGDGRHAPEDLASAALELVDAADRTLRTGAVATLREVAARLGAERVAEVLVEREGALRGLMPAWPIEHDDLERSGWAAVAAAATPADTRAVEAMRRLARERPWGKDLLAALAKLDPEWLIANARELVPHEHLGVLGALRPGEQERLIDALAPYPPEQPTFFTKAFWRGLRREDAERLRKRMWPG